MLNIINFIKSNSSWREILSAPPYNLVVKDDGEFSILKYSQIDSDLSNEMVRECRGLIINRELNPVCIPFFKFGNYGESYADKIDWTTACVEEKIDGSLIKLWNYDGKWMISTNGTIFAEKATLSPPGGVASPFSNYADLFKTAAQKAQLDFKKLNPCYTYMFELCSPYNRIVVPHNEIKIYHIGTRNNETLKELDVDIGIEKPKTYACDNITDLIKMAETLSFCEEGYVVRDAKYRRIKVKSPAYIAVHHLLGELSNKRLLELIRTNETDELLTYFPEYQCFIDTLNEKILNFEIAIEKVLKEQIDNVTFETRKDFAAVATRTKFPAFLFMYYDNKVKSAKEWLWGLSNEKILELLERTMN